MPRHTILLGGMSLSSKADLRVAAFNPLSKIGVRGSSRIGAAYSTNARRGFQSKWPDSPPGTQQQISEVTQGHAYEQPVVGCFHIVRCDDERREMARQQPTALLNNASGNLARFTQYPDRAGVAMLGGLEFWVALVKHILPYIVVSAW